MTTTITTTHVTPRSATGAGCATPGCVFRDPRSCRACSATSTAGSAPRPLDSIGGMSMIRDTPTPSEPCTPPVDRKARRGRREARREWRDVAPPPPVDPPPLLSPAPHYPHLGGDVELSVALLARCAYARSATETGVIDVSVSREVRPSGAAPGFEVALRCDDVAVAPDEHSVAGLSSLLFASSDALRAFVTALATACEDADRRGVLDPADGLPF